ncbi:hypothetical protein V6N11_036053 [Hibiscus sabdariffa]|uniref:Receptor-like protein 12 n=1 Tax=Hibiscus sabdariffa TaxID=183260 RepID=A0ABR2R988_9ROSI
MVYTAALSVHTRVGCSNSIPLLYILNNSCTSHSSFIFFTGKEMRILLLFLLFFTSYITIFFSITNLVFVSAQCLIDQRQLLLELNVTSGFNPIWLLTTSCPHFLLVLEKLSYLNLSDAGFEGQIPNGISRLTRLVTFDLSAAYLFSSKLEKPNLETLVQNLTRLRFLYLDDINIAATGKRWCQALSHLTELQVLSMSDCDLSGPIHSSFSKLRSLSVIRLDHNNLSASVPPFFAEFQNLTSLSMTTKFPNFPLNASLKTLSVGGCNFSGLIPKTVKELTQLAHLDFSSNSFSSPIPSFSSFRNLRVLNLANNQLSGTLHSTVWSLTFPKINSMAGLETLMVMPLYNLQGQLPMSVFKLRGLEALFLSSNNLSGLIPMSAFQNLSNLSFLDLSYNKFSVDATASNISPLSLPAFTDLYLASCNLTEFPHYLKNQSDLTYLDLSNNQIHGEIPLWIWTQTNLLYLNLSHNLLVEFQGPFKDITSDVGILDLHGNQLRGQIPFLPHAIHLDYSNNKLNSGLAAQVGDYLQFLYISSNKFHGSIPPSICNKPLVVLDLSNNSLSGSIPQCLFSMYLRVLNLRRNNLSGIISDTFPGECLLQTLNLNQNRLEGKVPKSLANCKSLEVLDIGNNQIKGTFPCHLKNIEQLQVLVLWSNKFNGHIDCPGSNSGWQMLQIFDIAANSFRGKLHLTCFGTWKAMLPSPDKDQSELINVMFDVSYGPSPYYQDAITVHIKNLVLELEKILTMYTSIDFHATTLKGQYHK